MTVCWAGILILSPCVRGWLRSWQRCWQHPASLLLYEVSVQHFETGVGTMGTGSAR